MQRDSRAYLNDIVEACEAIGQALEGMDLAAYSTNRLVRSAVEREFMIVGEAMAALSRLSPELFSRITHARRMVDTHVLVKEKTNKAENAPPTALHAVPTSLAEPGVDRDILRRPARVMIARGAPHGLGQRSTHGLAPTGALCAPRCLRTIRRTPCHAHATVRPMATAVWCAT